VTGECGVAIAIAATATAAIIGCHDRIIIRTTMGLLLLGGEGER